MILVLLPGMDGTGELFAALADELRTTCEVQVVRYPIDVPQGYAELMAFVQTRLPVGAPYVLLGESFSGPIAVRIGATRPAGLAGIVLAGTFLRSPSPWLRRVGPLVDWLPLAPVPRWARSWLLLGRHATPDLSRMLDQALAQVPPPVLRARLRSIAAVDVNREIAAIDVPLLCLHATEDRLISAAATQDVRRLHPSTPLVTLPGPHLLLQANPTASAAAIRTFLQTLPPVAFGSVQTTASPSP